MRFAPGMEVLQQTEYISDVLGASTISRSFKSTAVVHRLSPCCALLHIHSEVNYSTASRENPDDVRVDQCIRNSEVLLIINGDVHVLDEEEAVSVNMIGFPFEEV